MLLFEAELAALVLVGELPARLISDLGNNVGVEEGAILNYAQVGDGVLETAAESRHRELEWTLLPGCMGWSSS